MPETPTAPNRPILRDVPDVELLKVGEWPASTGPFTATPEVLAAAVRAAQSSAVGRPVIKLGHVDPRFDGEPAVGFVDNLRLSQDGSTLVGDLRGLPAWLADILPSAYPNRSIEGSFNYRDQTGMVHEFALTGLALLGVSPPAVGTLSTLRDVAALYDVAAGRDGPAAGEVAIMPDKIIASASVEDVRRDFYEQGPGADDFWWIEELFLSPPEIIAMDDTTGELHKVAYAVGDDDAIEWGEPETVRREYVAASTRTPDARWESAAESRGREYKPVAAAAEKEERPMEFTEEQAAALVKALGLDEGADADAIVKAVETMAKDAEKKTDDDEADDGKGKAPAAPVAASTIHAAADQLGLAVVDKHALAAERAERDKLVRAARERAVGDAIAAGKLMPARRDAALTQMEKGLLTADDLDSMEPLVTMAGREVGHGLGTDEDDDGAKLSAAADRAGMFGRPTT
ncbi:capsid maturation protease [Corynebacterium phage Bran]|nr:capsid maturation protease [Corynebacterium phage Bran]